jgi:hypothetical protein
MLGEDWAVLLYLDENELDLGQYFSTLMKMSLILGSTSLPGST